MIALVERRVRCALAGAAVAAMTFAAQAQEAVDYRRIVSLGPDVTEIAMALEAADRIIAVDRSSRFPDAANTKPNLGYRRTLSAEGVLALSPDLILAAEDIGPPEAVDVLKATNVPIVFVPEGNSEAGIAKKIEVIAVTLGQAEAGQALSERVRNEFRQAAALGAAIPTAERKRVVFFHGLVRLTGAGSETAADAIIQLSGGINPLADYKGYKAVSEESLLQARPEVVLMLSDGKGGPTPEEVFSNPSLAATPAGKSKALITLDGPYMLGFGPRTANAIRGLAHALYGER
ncbi:hemin ABC transporter substrate-binding protein [Tianweitania populi]|uniref:ABC transporter substrate-binding protein n=1 Tax=Tianweitania populi TaxID=1607949 RepID=A0A8J3GMS7_9HYPH|nr:ABC transporter substrate-binding protein [Tianweitania populi]GHD19276.1 ABC transporter substrate-binding protein [Tianweitania populi]